MKGSVYDTRWIIQTNSNVFWPDKLTSNVLDHDKQNSVESHQY